MTLEFRKYHKWPFILNGREVNIGDFLYVKNYRKVYEVKEMRLIYPERYGTPIPEVLINTFQGGRHSDINDYDEWIVFCSEYFSWPDEAPQKKKVAKWAYPVIGMPGAIRIEFTDEMTQEEAEEKFGSFVQMIPGTEREVGG